MSHLRLDPLSGEWVVVAARRMRRPLTHSAAACPFCPAPPGADAATRAASEAPDAAYDVAVFENRFPALGGEADPLGGLPAGAAAAPAGGRAEVVLYAPQHDTHLGELPERRVRLLVEVWSQRTLALEADPGVACVFVFENRGHDAGQTIDHPHGQIYGYPWVPPRIAREAEVAQRHRAWEGQCLQCALLRRDEALGERVVDAEGDWVALVPFAPRFPSEVHLVPRRHLGALPDLDAAEVTALARLLRRTVRRYDGLYGTPLPYMMGVYQRPRALAQAGLWHLRLAFYPVQRAAGRLKYLASSESGAGVFLLDASPEDMAAALRAVRL